MQLDFRYVHLALTAPNEVTVSFPHGIDIVESTKYMLNGFSETQLQRILLALDRAINTLIRIEHDLEPGLLIQRSDETDLHWMKLSEAQHNFDRDLDIPTVKNAHYYAVYALHQLGQSIKLAHDNGKTQFDEHSVRCLTDSVESLSLARLMQERGYRNRSHNDSSDFDANLSLWDEDLAEETSDADSTVDEDSSSQTPSSEQRV